MGYSRRLSQWRASGNPVVARVGTPYLFFCALVLEDELRLDSWPMPRRSQKRMDSPSDMVIMWVKQEETIKNHWWFQT